MKYLLDQRREVGEDGLRIGRAHSLNRHHTMEKSTPIQIQAFISLWYEYTSWIAHSLAHSLLDSFIKVVASRSYLVLALPPRRIDS